LSAGLRAQRRKLPLSRARVAGHRQRWSIKACVSFRLRRRLRLKIGEQLEASVAREGLMTTSPIDRDPDKFRTVVVEFGKHLIVERQLIAADRTLISRLERKNNPLSG
jgi:hypothetical protein